ncbi:MAG: hypothetical protein E7302_13350 [Butyrivibrio sp.]|nr:hypothetical protein [Butyrivibrio sp.]
MSNFLEGLDIDELRSSAEKILEITGDGAKKAYGKAKTGYDGLDDDTKKAITVGLCVFGFVLLIAGCFYLLGKHAGRKEQMEFEYEEWDA